MNNHLVFHTSGSTGAPRQWLRSREQMEDEARLIYQRWAPGVSEIIAFAPASHSYGQILGETGARVMGVPVQFCSLEQQRLPQLEGNGHCVILAIASTWRLLPGLLARLAGRQVLVLHSASLLPPDALSTVHQHAGPQVRFVELLGATETGAMAFREWQASSSADQPWSLLDDVELLTPVGQAAPLEIASPRIALEQGQDHAASSHRCDDVVQVLDARRFQWLGRASSLIKVNGLRVDLARLGSELGMRLGCPSLACVPVRDPLRAEAYHVLFSSPSLTESAVLDAFRSLPPGTPRPVAVRRVEQLPLSATGKPQPWAASFTVKEYTNVPC
ncbi:acyl-coenzyme A synthetase/AMP-(fatty) acid ligase [Pseudomonas hunanensis]|uniref:Acyl-coenzyme A synthetase/AMP-(Fatty) acid ligase n=1 Tax=Pseudomonas hunanensis TaxID=1247546 RepID=A0ACC6JXV7_9PSED|nr:AMP-binding protein [Pseudomonas hunanensis]MDR6711028.1 acyl-coenzyme A synthetase/AMP-(fatty) acid ligase [Pseudomonas hunanensis]